MENVYHEIIEFIVQEGKRIAKRAGKIDDIGITKKYLTEEDLIIERGLKNIIKGFDKSHELFAEEENNEFPDVENVWIADPISSTRSFVNGLPHYAIVVTHTYNYQPKFSAIYDPSMDELYYALAGEGTFKNGKLIKKLENKEKKRLRIIYNLFPGWFDRPEGRKLFQELTQFNLYRSLSSFGINYCYVACGHYDGFVTLCKDNFPEMAGSLIIKEVGGNFVNRQGDKNLKPEDRIFYGGNGQAFKELNKIFSKIDYL